MSKVTCDMSISVDGFAAGLNQRLDKPFGDDAEALHLWMFEHRERHAADFAPILAARAYIMGRNMFVRAAATGTRAGPAGGATSRRFTRRCSC
jgi:hypothetical protein